MGVVTRRNLLNLELAIDSRVRDLITRPPVTIYDDNTAREAADEMVRQQVGRLPVITHAEPRRVVGIVTRSDLLAAHARRLAATDRAARQIELDLGALSWRSRRALRDGGDASRKAPVASRQQARQETSNEEAEDS
jgi:signal-transduction protein with cAMP-binding, CBS, and nucleotidyltransferase domain